MTAPRLLLCAAAVVAALLLQTTLLARLPGGTADLLLVVVVAFALVEGPLTGTVTGFAAGLLSDLGADHELGRAALVYAVVGYGAGVLSDGRSRSVLRPLLVVAAAAVTAVTGYALVGLLLGDPRIGAARFWPALAGTTAYAVLLTPFVVPVVRSLLRRLDTRPLGR